MNLARLTSLVTLTFSLGAFACQGSDSSPASAGQDIVGGGGAPATAPPSTPAAPPSTAVAPPPTPPAGTSPASGSATVDTKPIQIKTDKCDADVKLAVVTVAGNPTVTQAINDLLNKDLADPCGKFAIDTHLDADSKFEVTANESGLLSIRVTGSTRFLEDDAQPEPFERDYNFDLATGKNLRLSDVISQSGKAKMVDACLADPDFKDAATRQECETSINETPIDLGSPPPLDNPAIFVATPKGIAVFIAVDLDAFDGDLVVPWATLQSELTSAPFAAYAKAHL
jgi:hypothetical protein